jgi:hypothetical protein
MASGNRSQINNLFKNVVTVLASQITIQNYLSYLFLNKQALRVKDIQAPRDHLQSKFQWLLHILNGVSIIPVLFLHRLLHEPAPMDGPAPKF